MNFLVIILILILCLIVLIMLFPLKVYFYVDSEELDRFKVKFSWLSSFITGTLKKAESKTTLTIYLFQFEIYKKHIINNRFSISNFNYFRTIKTKNISLYTSFGFYDPSITGMLCGLSGLISQYFDINTLSTKPNFTTDYDYFNIYCSLEINMFQSIINILKLKKTMPLVQG